VVGIGVGNGGFCRRNGVGIGGQRTFIGVRNDRGGVADGWGSAVFVGSSGCETIVAVPRAAGSFGTLVGGLAGIAADVAENARVLGAILGSPYSDTSQVGM
jgi:hypothetical protein